MQQKCEPDHMANKRRIEIFIPELDRTTGDKALTEGLCVLVLETDKAYRGGVECDGRVHWQRNGFQSTVLFQDYAKTYVTRPGVATQKKIDTQHAEIFTEARILEIVTEVRAFYAALDEKRRAERARYETSSGLGAAVADLTDSGIDASRALSMLNAD